MIHSILSGILIGTSYIPFPPWALLFCLTPLWYYWVTDSNLTYRRIFISGWITQFILDLIGFHWVAHTVMEFGQMPWPVGVIALILHAATQNLHIPLAGICWLFLIRKKPISLLRSLLALALLTATFETYYPMVFTWNMGYPWIWSRWPIFQWADTVGFVGLSYITMIVNASLLYSYVRRKDGLRAYRIGIASLLIFGLLNITGYFKGKQWSGGDRVARVAVVQANIGNFEKAYAEAQGSFRPMIYREYFKLTRQHIEKDDKLDFVLWPETAFPDDLDPVFNEGVHQRSLRSFIQRNQIHLITGAYSTNIDTNEYYNGIFSFNRDGEYQDVYRKSHLLAFGEYFPFADKWPWLLKLFPAVSDFSRGGGPKTFQVDALRVGPQVCYEGLYPDFSSDLSEKGANLLVNVTNDSWFGHTFEPLQHLYMTFARAIETRRPLLRSTNTGITSAILSDGEVLEKGPEKEVWTKTFEIPYRLDPDVTIYSRIDKFVPLIFLLFLITLFLWPKTRINPKVHSTD